MNLKHIKKSLKVILFSLIPAFFLFLLTEGFLRIVGFQYSNTPLYMIDRSYDDRAVVRNVINFNERYGIRFVKDPYQLWVPMKKFGEGHGLDKDASTIRIATLGDSCTAICVGTKENYPSFMQELLSNHPLKKFEVLNAGVGSHSSYQGLQRLKYSVLPFKPDVITIFYGWNDHWVTLKEDKDVKMPSETMTEFINFVEKFRIFQGLNYLLSKRMDQARERELVLRVSIDDYRNNLNAMIDLAEAENIKTLLITAPYDLRDFKPFSNFPYSKERLIPLHKRYNQVVREVARARNIAFLDLENVIASAPKGLVMSDDGVHFSPQGCQLIAKFITQKLVQLGLP